MYAAFETAAKNPLSCLCFAADGMSKDKTKVSYGTGGLLRFFAHFS